jgi:ATP-dependent DNA helicase RecQ
VILSKPIIRGKSQGKEEAFRSDYGRLGELRSLMRKDVPFVTLTATSTVTVKNYIIENLSMQDCVEVLDSPNRTNIRYAVVDIEIDNLYTSFSWLIDELMKSNISTSKVIVFCRRKQHMKDLYELFMQHMGEKAYYMPTGEEHMDDRSRLFAMYHKKTNKLVKETVEKEFCKSTGTIRVLFCSIAFGMGVNIKDTFLDLHLGPAADLDDYLQETGRIGRESTQLSHAVLLKYKGCTSSKNITTSMRNYVKNNDSCRRKILLSHFGADDSTVNLLHECCDICACACKCLCECISSCLCFKKCTQDGCPSPVEKHLHDSDGTCNSSKDKDIIHNLPQSSISKLESDLLQYRSHLNDILCEQQSSNMLTGFDVTTGYSRGLIANIVENIKYIKDKDYLNENFAFFAKEHMDKTWEIIHCVLSDAGFYVELTVNAANDCSNSDSEISAECSSSDESLSNVKRNTWLHTRHLSSGDEISTSSQSS